MNLRLLFFSVLRDVTGVAETDWQCAPDATVASLLLELYERWPRLRDWDQSLLVAVDQSYVKRDATLREGAEVAVMPPVQGG